jgi:uncharacterized protein YecE (DUF72 family)
MHVARLEANSVPGTSQLKVNTDLHIGCSGWYYWHWKSCFYTETLPRSNWFNHYISRFKTWIRQTGRRKLSYMVKVSELITHIKRFEGTQELVKDFGYIADLLGQKMGCFLFQLPPSFHYTPERMNNIISQLDPSRRNVVEFRHRSWWNEEVYDAFRKSGIIFCSCSGPKLRMNWSKPLTSYTSVFMVSNNGIDTITSKENSQYGRNASTKAVPPRSGHISIMTATAMPLRTPENYSDN